MPVTIKDIAKRAGVSYSTVSRALNNVSAGHSENKQKILNIAKEMGYIPNQAAVQLKMSRSYTIGVYFSTISKMTSPFVLHDVLTGVYDVVGSRYNVVVKGIDMHQKGELNPSFYDGIIVLSQRTEDSAFIDEVLEKEIPVVAICRIVPYNIPNVVTDEAKAMERGMNYLLDRGHRRIAVIEGIQGLDSTSLRHIGWRNSMLKHGLDPDGVHIETGNYRYSSGYAAARRILTMDPLPTAILCFNDEMAFAAKAAVQEKGLDVPDDVSLIGFDNWNMSSFGNMRLTTIERNMGDLAREGTKILVKRMESGIIDNARVYLDNKLVERESVRTLNQEDKNESWVSGT